MLMKQWPLFQPVTVSIGMWIQSMSLSAISCSRPRGGPPARSWTLSVGASGLTTGSGGPPASALSGSGRVSSCMSDSSVCLPGKKKGEEEWRRMEEDEKKEKKREGGEEGGEGEGKDVSATMNQRGNMNMEEEEEKGAIASQQAIA